MRLNVFGLGYVGCVTAACLAGQGHEVVGVDVNEAKVDLINGGRSPIIEPGVGELIAEAVKGGRLRATTDAGEAVAESDLSLLCVGTPSNHNGSLDLTQIKRVCREVGAALAGRRRYHIVAVRSTLLPGTAESIVIPTLEVYAGQRWGRDFGVVVNPEFLREGTSVDDFSHPPFTVIGADDEDAAGPVARLYADSGAPVVRLGLKEAEMVKYACNCFHALKVTFANEIGNICQGLGVDSHEVMEVFCRDTKLNLSPAYLKPGFAFGGSCLPKDVRAVTHKAKELDLSVPVLDSILASNRLQVEKAVGMVLQTGRKHVGVLGLSFKPGTDDLRESPMVAIVEALIGKGLKLTVYDREVELARLFGANKEFIEREIPHISSLLRPGLAEVIEGAEVIIIGKKEDRFRAALGDLTGDRVIIDLVRLLGPADGRRGHQLIC